MESRTSGPAALQDLGRLLRTVSHLRAGQVMARAARLLPASRPELSSAVPTRHASGAWAAAVRRADSYVDARHMRFLHETHAIDDPAVWRTTQVSKLWRYHLHYFDDLNAVSAATRVSWHEQLLHRWIAENAPTAGEGWEPYPTSLRIVNWIKWSQVGNRLSEKCLLSLARQAAWLARNLERHLLGNHLFENAKALVFAGLFFDGPAAAQWLATGWRILREELSEQVLGDGGHLERSPMYHAIVLEGILDIANLARRCGVQPPLDLAAPCSKMLTWLQALSHPDGQIALLNDATLDEAPSHAQLHAYAQRLGMDHGERVQEPLHVLGDSGYIRVQLGPAVALLDVAPLGPDYLPGHGHADALTFELSLEGRRVVVDTGVSTYQPGPRREQERSTAAHNTWTINGRDSSEMWAAFRVGRRARIRNVSACAQQSAVEAAAEHDGYAHVKCRGIHRRTWTFSPDGLVLTDRFSGNGRVRLEGALHFHPSLQLEQTSSSSWRVRDESRLEVLEVVPDAAVRVRLVDYSFAPNFGELHPAAALRFCTEAHLPVTLQTRLAWCADRPGAAQRR